MLTRGALTLLAAGAAASALATPAWGTPPGTNGPIVWQSLSGDEFDREYMRTQLADHQRTATLLQWQIGSGEHGGLKEYAIETLPVVMSHIEAARGILDRLAQQQR